MEALSPPHSGSMQRQSNRIARNSVVLFLRMFVIMLLNLYIVRLLLAGLGKEDYGTYNAVAGVVTALTCLSSILAISTQRFYSFVAGTGDYSKLKNIFAVSLNINILLSVIVILLAETIGLWYISSHLPIPPQRLTAALYVYHFSCVAFVCSLLQIPYMAAIIAHEDMEYFAFISLGDCLLRLMVAALIVHVGIDHLIFYSAGLAVIAFINLALYVLVGRRYPECHYRRTRNRQLYRTLVSFSGWTFFGSLASVAMLQGNTILLYDFFGPLATAAFAISVQINHAFNSLCNSTVLAFRPAMIRSYAEGNMDYVTRMFFLGNKFVLYILAAIAVPLILEMDTILRLWLGKEYTAETLLFSRLMIISVIIVCLHNPVTIIIHAIGKVKPYHLICESIMLLCLPLSWLCFCLGMSASACFLSMISVCTLAHVARLLCLRRFYDSFSIAAYIRSLVLPALIIVALVVLLSLCFHALFSSSLLRLMVVGLVAPLAMLSLVFVIGLESEERVLVQRMFSSILR